MSCHQWHLPLGKDENILEKCYLYGRKYLLFYGPRFQLAHRQNSRFLLVNSPVGLVLRERQITHEIYRNNDENSLLSALESGIHRFGRILQ